MLKAVARRSGCSSARQLSVTIAYCPKTCSLAKHLLEFGSSPTEFKAIGCLDHAANSVDYPRNQMAF